MLSSYDPPLAELHDIRGSTFLRTASLGSAGAFRTFPCANCTTGRRWNCLEILAGALIEPCWTNKTAPVVPSKYNLELESGLM